MPDIVISEFMNDAAVAVLSAKYDVLYDPDLVDKPDELASALINAKALIVRNRTQVRGGVLTTGKHLKAVGRLGVGLDNIDLDDCKERGIAVLPASGANDDAVAEYVIATAMTLVRGSYLNSASVAAGKWPRQAMIGMEVMGKTLGLVGFGGIARETAGRAAALGMSIAAFDPFVSADDAVWQGAERHETLESLLAVSDVVSLHVPLTDGTRNLIDGDAIMAMKDTAVLINTARGGVVDEEALATALKDGNLRGAAIDVFASEPMAADAGQRFVGIDNIILTAHIGGVTEESNVRVSAVTAQNVLRVLED